MRIPEVTSHLFLKYYLNITKMKLASKEKNGNVKNGKLERFGEMEN